MTKPLPTPTGWDAEFWTLAARGILAMQACAVCGSLQFYPRPVCTGCFGRDLSWRPVSGRGRVHSFTFVRAPVHPAFKPEVPVILVEVELEEGVRMLSRLVECGPDEVALGAPVSVVFVPTARDDIRLPHFRLAR
jgi:uncharacterized protein